MTFQKASQNKYSLYYNRKKKKINSQMNRFPKLSGKVIKTRNKKL